ncbi:GNAT family N-acetyltransferase [Streptomyces sp. PTM05]|uniref:GNAT family N-acetyltransferase n=1 Tax=Streptantibioticus parmotrematis TaxID=2873249 RepID=A0ABS7QUE9_9ACTN|nr:GNAT family N-acetyltransferase [Streptantibioticus parmotrematis]MBY8886825.1 GNAT family N-acetyltransferase [Streptantibioticus parmotrematis]
MSSVVVRPFEPTDLAGAAKALVEVHETDGYPVEGVEEPQAWLSSEDTLAAWVSESGGSITGHVSLMEPRGEGAVSLWIEQSGEDEARVAVLARLFVVRAARENATGKRLVEEAMRYARANELRLVLDVMTKDAAAIRLYERLGWNRIGETTHHFGDGEAIQAICFVSPQP